MVEVADERPDAGEDEEHAKVDAEDRQREVGQRAVDDDLTPVEAETPDPVELDDRVVELVELSQPGHAMEQVVAAPFDQVLPHERQETLRPERHRAEDAQRLGRR